MTSKRRVISLIFVIKCISKRFLLLADIVALFANEAWFFRFRVIFQACSLLKEVGDSPFFTFHISNSSTLSGKNLRKKSMLEHFRANVLIWKFWTTNRLIRKQYYSPTISMRDSRVRLCPRQLSRERNLELIQNAADQLLLVINLTEPH